MDKKKLSPETRTGGCDLIVGIPSYNEADSISYVVKQVDAGITKYFPTLKALIVNVDNDSPDNTKKAFLETITKTPKHYISTPPKTKGKGRNFHNLFLLAQQLNPQATVVVDADLKSITPEWVLHLAGQVMNGHDFISPLYLRHKYDGTITNQLVYPLVFSLIGKNIRQPIGGDFAFSTRLASHWLEQDWKESTHQFGIDNFMTLHALMGDFSVCQTGLGVKDHKPSAPKLGYMFVEVIDTLFENLLQNNHLFEQKDQTLEVPKSGLKEMGTPKKLTLEDIGIDLNVMIKNTIELFEEYKPLIYNILDEKTYQSIEQMLQNNNINIDSKQWAKIIYDFMIAFHNNPKQKLEIVECLKPLYFARNISFIKQTINHSCQEAEQLILKQAQTFRELKPYLLKKLGVKILH
ncbi:glycosyltransferase [Candidatus Woesearchaeota archaeon]|nr:glycosyltransferase [Candidatus Woesearchaeota archaeon]